MAVRMLHGSAAVPLLPVGIGIEMPLVAPLHQGVSSGLLLPGLWLPPESAKSRGEERWLPQTSFIILRGVKRVSQLRPGREASTGNGVSPQGATPECVLGSWAST